MMRRFEIHQQRITAIVDHQIVVVKLIAAGRIATTRQKHYERQPSKLFNAERTTTLAPPRHAHSPSYHDFAHRPSILEDALRLLLW